MATLCPAKRTIDAMQDLNDMLFFAEVAERGGFTAASKALNVPTSPDVYRTQPTGNAGARIACGVIAKA